MAVNVAEAQLAWTNQGGGGAIIAFFNHSGVRGYLEPLPIARVAYASGCARAVWQRY